MAPHTDMCTVLNYRIQGAIFLLHCAVFSENFSPILTNSEEARKFRSSLQIIELVNNLTPTQTFTRTETQLEYKRQ